MLDQPTDNLARLRAAADDKAGVTGIKQLADGKSDEFRVNPFLIRVEQGFNARDFGVADGGGIAELAQSIATHGVMKALTVRLAPDGSHVILVDGERRLRATLHAVGHLGASIANVPVRMEARGTNEVDRLASQVVHNSGRSFTDLELGSIVRRLSAYGWDPSKIAQQTGIDVRKQQTVLYLLEAPAAVHDMMRRGDVSSDAVTKTMRRSSSPGEAAEKLGDAVREAKVAGRKRVTASDVSGNEPTLQRLLQLVWEECYRGDQVTEEKGSVTWTMSPAQWAIVSRRFGIRL